MNTPPCRVSADLNRHHDDIDQRLMDQEMREEQINAIAVPILLDRIRQGAPEFWEGLTGEGLDSVASVNLRTAIVVAVDCFHSHGPRLKRMSYEHLGQVIAEQVSDYMLPIIKGELP